MKTQWKIQGNEIQVIGPELGRGAWATVSVAIFRETLVAAKTIHHQILSQHNIHFSTRDEYGCKITPPQFDSVYQSYPGRRDGDPVRTDAY